MNARKQAILSALNTFIRQRPGLEFGNYGDVSTYRAEMRSITKDRHHAQTLMAQVAWRDTITADDLIHAAESAFSGRLTIREDGEKVIIDYCTGQYFPTEYRRAVCSVMAAALWSYTRDKCMPEPTGKIKAAHGFGAFRSESEFDNIEGKTPGAWLRSHFRKEFGRGIAARWFN